MKPLQPRSSSAASSVAPQTATEPKHTQAGDGSRRIVVLVVDDDQGDCELISRAFDDCGAQVDLRFAPDGEAAIEYLANCRRGHQERPRLVLLDLNVPKMDGKATLRLIRDDPAFKALPVIVFTASEREADVLKCYQYGANSYFTKPTDLGGYRKVIRILESYWLRRAELPPDTL
jgi:two-component system response regulator